MRYNDIVLCNYQEVDMKKRALFCLLFVWIWLVFTGCFSEVKNEEGELIERQGLTGHADSAGNNQYIVPEGNTLATRIKPPDNYERIPDVENSFTAFLRNFSLKRDGSPVLLYDGEKKYNQSAHVAVFDLEVGNQDLQQCADSIIRMYAEYYRSIGEDDKIAFHLTNGFLLEYVKWRDGYRLAVSGNDTSWRKSAGYDDTYENFQSYLKTVYMYAGTLSLEAECTEINLAELAPGDLFIEGGSPGHCVLVIDLAENSAGEKAFLLAQGYMPAQEFHVLKNPLYEDDPWYYASELTYPLKTPEWTFAEGSLARWGGWE